MNNIGGIRKIYVVDPDDYIGVEIDENGIYTLTLAEDPSIEEIEMGDETGKMSEADQEDDQGPLYNFEFLGRIPGSNITGYANIRAALERRRILLMEDNNENFWLSGYPGAYFRVARSRDTGAMIQDLHQVSVQITAVMDKPSIPIYNPFTIS